MRAFLGKVKKKGMEEAGDTMSFFCKEYFAPQEKTSYFRVDRVHHASCLAQRTRVELLFYIDMKYSKQPLTLERQIALLKDRGLAIIDENVARSLDLPQHKILESWAASLAALRNCCAHHARIWNRNYPVTPAIPIKLKNAWISNTAVADNKLYIQLCCIAYLLNNIHPENTFTLTLKELIATYPNVDIAAMGFPPDWKTEALWQ